MFGKLICLVTYGSWPQTMTELMSIADAYATADSAMIQSIRVNENGQPITDEPDRDQAGPSNFNRNNRNHDCRDDRSCLNDSDNQKRGGVMSDERYVVATTEGNQPAPRGENRYPPR